METRACAGRCGGEEQKIGDGVWVARVHKARIQQHWPMSGHRHEPAYYQGAGGYDLHLANRADFCADALPAAHHQACACDTEHG